MITALYPPRPPAHHASWMHTGRPSPVPPPDKPNVRAWLHDSCAHICSWCMAEAHAHAAAYDSPSCGHHVPGDYQQSTSRRGCEALCLFALCLPAASRAPQDSSRPNRILPGPVCPIHDPSIPSVSHGRPTPFRAIRLLFLKKIPGLPRGFAWLATLSCCANGCTLTCTIPLLDNAALCQVTALDRRTTKHFPSLHPVAMELDMRRCTPRPYHGTAPRPGARRMRESRTKREGEKRMARWRLPDRLVPSLLSLVSPCSS